LENSKTGFALKKKEMPSYLKIRTSREKKDGFFLPIWNIVLFYVLKKVTGKDDTTNIKKPIKIKDLQNNTPLTQHNFQN